MGQIILKDPMSPYSCEIDTGALGVELRKIFLGVRFVTEDGEELAVSMRDSGFELSYKTHHGTRDVSLKEGIASFGGLKNE